MKKSLLVMLAFVSGSCFAYDELLQSEPVNVLPPIPHKIGELTGNFDLTTNYIFRGLSASNNLPAVQGGLTYTFLKPGIYFNIWGSSTSITAHDETASVEIDTIVGVRNDITKNLSYDISLARYNYPKAPHIQFNEFIPKISYKISSVTLTPSIAYTPNILDFHKPATYYNARVDWDIPAKYCLNFHNITASGSVGRWYLPKSVGLNTYSDYMLGLSKTINSYVLMIEWIDTTHRVYHNSLDDSRIVGTVLVNF